MATVRVESDNNWKVKFTGELSSYNDDNTTKYINILDNRHGVKYQWVPASNGGVPPGAYARIEGDTAYYVRSWADGNFSNVSWFKLGQRCSKNRTESVPCSDSYDVLVVDGKLVMYNNVRINSHKYM